MAQPPVQFSGVLRGLRAGAGLTQEELAEAAGLSSRAVSDLERGIVATPHKDTVRLLADALHLHGVTRVEFEAAARGRALGGATAAGMGTLPRDIDSFAGRRRELAELEHAAISATESERIIGVHAIDGMAGVGKTAFAVHAAHRLAGRFPGGRIFLPLHGHTPGHQPASPADALASLLLMIGVPAAQIPAGLETRAGLWRDRVAGRRLLLVLDDATDSEQVRPLLPGTGGSMVLVTSRRRLLALEDARTITIGVLPPEDASALLVRLAARPGLSPADPAIASIARLCGHLPLAIGLLGRQLHHHPSWDVAERAAELAGAVSRLDLLATENASVAAAFDLSYENLTPEHQRMFRRLGLNPGAEVDAYAAAALDGAALPAARRGLEALYDQHLLTEPAPGRYRMHDLLRQHARDLAWRLDSGDVRGQARARLLDYYQSVACRAHEYLVGTTGDRAASATPAVAPALTDREQALAWARVERGSLLACLRDVAAAGEDARVVALTASVAELFRIDGPWAEAITLHSASVQAARRAGDRHGQAGAIRDLSRVRLLSGDYGAAARGLAQALGIYRDLGDRAGQANVLIYLGIAGRLTGDYLASARELQESLSVYRDLGDRPGQANALNNLGKLWFIAADYPAAERHLREAADIHCDLGNRCGQAEALASLGYVRRLTGDYPAAVRDLEAALGMLRDLGDRRGQADALTFLGEARQLSGDLSAAAMELKEAHEIYRDLGSRGGQANTLLQLGIVRRLTGDYPAASRDVQQALRMFRSLGNRSGELDSLNEAGTQSRDQGDLDKAEAYHHEALDPARETGSPWEEGQALKGLGRCAVAAGRTDRAKDLLRQAVAIFERIGAPDTDDAAAELGALSGTSPGPASVSA